MIETQTTPKGAATPVTLATVDDNPVIRCTIDQGLMEEIKLGAEEIARYARERGFPHAQVQIKGDPFAVLAGIPGESVKIEVSVILNDNMDFEIPGEEEEDPGY